MAAVLTDSRCGNWIFNSLALESENFLNFCHTFFAFSHGIFGAVLKLSKDISYDDF